jgi:tetratricopeptide (TPR) repeat protein
LIRISNFGVLFILAAFGLAVTAGQWRRLWVLYALFLTYGAGVTLFIVFDRYRFPCVAFLLPFAGAGLMHGIRLARERKFKKIIVPACVAAVAGLIAFFPFFSKNQISAVTFLNIGSSLKPGGNAEKAMGYYRQSLELNPNGLVAHQSLGMALARQGEYGPAMDHFLHVLRLNPNFSEGYILLSGILARDGHDVVRKGEAIFLDQRYLALVFNNIARILATHENPECRNGRVAVELAETACRITEHKVPAFLNTLAATWAEAGNYDRAIRVSGAAVDLSLKEGREFEAKNMESRLSLYRAELPLREKFTAPHLLSDAYPYYGTTPEKTP